MKCLSCGTKLRKISEDYDYDNWRRKYHKKCYREKEEYEEIKRWARKQKLHTRHGYDSTSKRK